MFKKYKALSLYIYISFEMLDQKAFEDFNDNWKDQITKDVRIQDHSCENARTIFLHVLEM